MGGTNGLLGEFCTGSDDPPLGLYQGRKRRSGAGSAFVIDICTSPWSVRAYGPSNFIVADACRADFFMATTNAGCANACPGKTIIKVERMGVVLGVVKDRRDAKADEIGGRTAATR